MNKDLFLSSIFVILLSIGVTSCGSFGQGILMGLDNMYGGGYGMYGNYSSYGGVSSFVDNTSYSSIPNMVQNAVDQAAPIVYQQALNNVQTFDATLEKQKNNLLDSYAKDFWEHPERYQSNDGTVNGGTSGIGIDNLSSSSSNTSSNNSNTSGRTSQRECSYCKGKKRVPKEFNTGTYGLQDTKVYCNECGKSFWKSSGHAHVSCPVCRGDGYVK